jgi:hypothetical protein
LEFGTPLALSDSGSFAFGFSEAVDAPGCGSTRRLIFTNVPSGFLTVTILNWAFC